MGLVYSFCFLLVYVQSEDVSHEYCLFLTDEEVTTSSFSQALLRTVFVDCCAVWVHKSRVSVLPVDKILYGDAKDTCS